MSFAAMPTKCFVCAELPVPEEGFIVGFLIVHLGCTETAYQPMSIFSSHAGWFWSEDKFMNDVQAAEKAVELAFVHVGQDLEEQQELLECLLAFVLQFLLADDDVACLLPGQH